MIAKENEYQKIFQNQYIVKSSNEGSKIQMINNIQAPL